jgi:segregation and condensation protein A
MTSPFQPSLDFEAAERASDTGEALVLDLDGFEGPLHLLLALARNQKVDLLQISIARLAEQYLAFVETQRRFRFGLAAEYLVMASWLAYLKSRLLLPRPEAKGSDEPLAEELAEMLAFRLAKLDAMRGAAEALRSRPQLGRDVFGRGAAADGEVGRAPRLQEDLYGLMAAYAAARLRPEPLQYRPAARVEAYGLEAARERLRAWLPRLRDWTPLREVAPRRRDPEGPSPASYVASTFSAGLEMTKDAALELRQAEAFAELYLRARSADAP